MIFENHWSRFRTSSLIFFRTTSHMSMYLTLTSRSFLWKERTAQHWLELLGPYFVWWERDNALTMSQLTKCAWKTLPPFLGKRPCIDFGLMWWKLVKDLHCVRCLLGRFQWVPSDHLNSTWLACLIGSNGTAHQLNFIWLALFGVTTLKRGQTILKMPPLVGAYDSSSTQLMSLWV